jgi:GT2 family glycosyltransferase
MASAIVIIPSTGDPMAARAVTSVLDQTYPGVRALVVIDGPDFLPAWNETKSRLADKAHADRLDVVALAENTGGGGFYGHRIYAAFPHLVNEDIIFFLDQDNWYEPNHVASLIEVLERPGNNQFAFSLRKVFDSGGNFLCRDDCESLGKWPVWNNPNNFHIDTSAYAFKRDFLKQVCHLWDGGWGMDRRFIHAMKKLPIGFETSGLYTLNYRLGGNEDSVIVEIFTDGNRVQEQKFGGIFPWAKKA